MARILAEHGRCQEAVEWARRGLELFWDAFDQTPSLEAYRRLLDPAFERATRLARSRVPAPAASPRPACVVDASTVRPSD